MRPRLRLHGTPSGRATTAMLVLACFAALAAVFFLALWSPDAGARQMIGAADGDFARQFYPYRVFVARTWAAGRLPAWNPHQYGGTPALADPQQGVLYPWRLLQVPFALWGRTLPLWLVELEAVAHVVLGGWFVWLLARKLGAGSIGALAAGVVFAFGGYLTGYPIEQMAVVDTAIWMAPALWGLTTAVEGARSEDRRAAGRGVVVAGVSTALAGLAGHPQTAVYGVYLGLAWLAFAALRRKVSLRSIVAIAACWLLLAAGLSAPQWVPSGYLLRVSDRSVPAEEMLVGLHVADLQQMLVAPPPRIPGADADGVVTAGEIVWAPLFVGAVALLLATWGTLRASASRFWVATAAMAAVLAMGGHTPVFAVAARFIPGLALFRHAERFAVLFALAVALAVGLSLDALLQRERDVSRPAVAALAAAAGLAVAAAWVRLSATPGSVHLAGGLALAALFGGALGAALLARARGWASARALGAVMVVLLVLELFGASRGRALTPYVDAYAPDPIVDALLPRARDGRVSSEGLLAGGPNAASVHGLYDIAGDVVLRPATIARLEGMPEMVRWRLMDVRYVVSRRTFDAGEPVRLIQRHGDVGLYEVQLGVAPAWVPLTWTESWSAFWNPAPDFDPMAEAVVPDAYAGMRSEGVWASGDTSGSAELVGLEPGRAVVQAHLADQGYLVWSSLDVPASLIGNAFGVPASGWSATAESLTAVGTGSAAAALYPRVGTRPAFTETPAYGVSPAVALPAGDWSVTWTYVPSGLHLGLALSGAATLLGALLWLRRPALGR